MSEVAQEAQHEFWRPPSPLTAAEIVPPIPQIVALPSMAEACNRCGSEFLMGSHFCHSCGGRRADAAVIAGMWQQFVDRTQAAGSAVARLKFPSWLRYLQFHEIQTRVGLSTASLIAFLIGLGCVAGALLVGLITAKTFVDWQAIQFYRAEWLLAATASFVAGILLKKSPSRDRD